MNTFEEIRYILNQFFEKQIKIRQVLFSKLIYPILSNQVDLNNFDAIKLMLKLSGVLSGFQELTGNYKYSYKQLIEQGLSLQPYDIELLENRELNLRNYIGMTLHELPIGVLYENNGATIEECDELLQNLNYYLTICDRLKVDHSDLVSEATYYYKAYKNYLSVYQQFHGFKDYLAQLDTKEQLT